MLLALGTTIPFSPAFGEGMSLVNGLPATPLVLKDGRIARVSIHTIPFPEDAEALTSATADELEIFTQTMATDCFLTAQVIGHVDKTETSGRGTADIHRLARARADVIQSSLIANGLPAASIASVWDWQFMVKDARATLWMFRLTAGDDCQDDPLNSVSQELVAVVDEPAAEAAAAHEANLSDDQQQPVEQRIVAATKTTLPQVSDTIPASVSNSETKTKSDQKVMQAIAPAPEASAPTQLTAVTTPAHEADKKGRVVVSDGGALEITFATNSSYLPQGWKEPLKSFLDRIDRDKGYIVRMQTSLDGGSSVTGSSSEVETARYNKWLADRRFERVKAWLLKNSEGATLQIEPTEVINDGSRRVIVELNPLG